MKSLYLIQEGIKIPSCKDSASFHKKNKHEGKYLFIEEMKPGQSFLCSHEDRSSIYSLISKGYLKSKLTSKKEGDKVRIWKL